MTKNSIFAIIFSMIIIQQFLLLGTQEISTTFHLFPSLELSFVRVCLGVPSLVLCNSTGATIEPEISARD